MTKRIPFSLVLIFLFLILLCNCTYKPKLEFDRGIKKPDSAVIGISLLPQDTAYTFYESADLNFYLRMFGLPLYSVSFFMDDNKIYSNEDTAGVVHLDFNTYYPGTFTLTMVVTTGSNSGSLADLLHAEGFVFSQKWKIHFIHPDPPVACQIIRIKDTNGTSMITWKKYQGIAFKEYEIFKAADLNGNIWDERMIRTITYQGDTSIFDSTALGGTVYYRVEVVNSGGYAYSNYYMHETNKSGLKAIWIGGENIKLTWNQSQFYRNFDKYVITDETSSGNVIYSTDSIGVNSFIYNGGIFGGTMKFTIRLYGKHPSYCYNDDNNSTATVDVGQTFPAFDEFYNTSVNHIAYLLKDYKLTRRDLASSQTYGTVDLGYGTSWCAVSPDDNLIITPTGWDSYQKIIPSNFFHIETVQLPVSYGPCMETTLAGAGSGMGHMEMPQNGYFIYNFLNNTMVFSKNTTSLSCGRISPDGNYVITGFSQGSPLNCYRITNNDFEFVWTNASTPCDFIPKTNLVVLVNTTTSTVDIRDAASGQLVYSFKTGSGESYHDTDPDNPLMLFSTLAPWNQKGRLTVYNYTTGAKVYEVYSLNSGWAPFAIQDATIYSGVGFQLKMQ